jgi:P27 family predicted phage terminase small subunit
MAGKKGSGGKKGRSGPPKKPMSLHLLEGTYRTTRHKGTLEVEKKISKPFDLAPLPPPPKDLEPKAKALWIEMAASLEGRYFSKPDLYSFRPLVETYIQFLDTTKHITEHGTVTIVERTDGRLVESISPQCKIWLTTIDKLKGYFAIFGMSPADRARLHVDTEIPSALKRHPDDEFNAPEEDEKGAS